jgi:hypothetical protein
MCEIGRRIYAKGFAAANDGNITVRLSDKEILCTPTMVSKGFMKPEDICKVDYEGKQLAGTRKRTSECLLHLSVYKERPDVQAVVHCHPPYATAFAVAREPIGHSLALAATVEPHHQARLFPGPAPGPQPEAERAMPAAGRAHPLLDVLHRRPPEQRAVCEEPDFLPLGMRGEHLPNGNGVILLGVRDEVRVRAGVRHRAMNSGHQICSERHLASCRGHSRAFVVSELDWSRLQRHTRELYGHQRRPPRRISGFSFCRKNFLQPVALAHRHS